MIMIVIEMVIYIYNIFKAQNQQASSPIATSMAADCTALSHSSMVLASPLAKYLRCPASWVWKTNGEPWVDMVGIPYNNIGKYAKYGLKWKKIVLNWWFPINSPSILATSLFMSSPWAFFLSSQPWIWGWRRLAVGWVSFFVCWMLGLFLKSADLFFETRQQLFLE